MNRYFKGFFTYCAFNCHSDVNHKSVFKKNSSAVLLLLLQYDGSFYYSCPHRSVGQGHSGSTFKDYNKSKGKNLCLFEAWILLTVQPWELVSSHVWLNNANSFRLMCKSSFICIGLSHSMHHRGIYGSKSQKAITKEQNSPNIAIRFPNIKSKPSGRGIWGLMCNNGRWWKEVVFWVIVNFSCNLYGNVYYADLSWDSYLESIIVTIS